MSRLPGENFKKSYLISFELLPFATLDISKILTARSFKLRQLLEDNTVTARSFKLGQLTEDELITW